MYLDNINLNDADLRYADLGGCIIEGGNFEGVDLDQIMLSAIEEKEKINSSLF